MDTWLGSGRRGFLKRASSAGLLLSLPQLCGLAAAASQTSTKVAPARREDGFRPLFDGHSLTGWKPHPRELANPSLGIWTVENGMLVGGQAKPKVGSYLTTEETFADSTHNVRLDYAPPAERFLQAWSLNGWNRYRIRSVGAVPHLTTWVNGEKVAELDTAKMNAPGWDTSKVDALVGRAGHIALEVHSNGPTDWLGNDRWRPGAVCRWRNIQIKTL